MFFLKTKISTSKPIIKEKKGKQKNDHMQVTFYNQGCVCGALRKNNMQNNKAFNSQLVSSEGIGL